MAASAAARDFLAYVNASPSPFHAVSETVKRLTSAGFVRLSEREPWTSLTPGGRYFCTRNQTALVAFVVGSEFRAGNGFTVSAAHTDSPCLRIKPKSSSSREGLEMVGCEWYGGGIWHTWFDRDLAVAGRVLVKEGSRVRSVLVDVKKPLLRVPSLAIHLDRTVNEGFTVDKEAHLWAVLSESKSGASSSAAAGGGSSDAPSGSTEAAETRHSSTLVEELASAAEVKAADVIDFELCLYDATPSALGGAKDEFVYSGRLDNLLSCYCGVEAIVKAADDAKSHTSVLGLFDNEEVGSSSVPGAGSTFLHDVLIRVNEALPGHEGGAVTESTHALSMRKSLLVSVDMAHAAHPNYPDRHDRNHRPRINGGPVIKNNTNQRYATTAVTAAAVRRAAAAVDTPVQEFVIKQDIGCGSTIGPILSTSLGMRTVDIGVAQLSMHSVREMCGAHDVQRCTDLLASIYRNWPAYDADMEETD